MHVTIFAWATISADIGLAVCIFPFTPMTLLVLCCTTVIAAPSTLKFPLTWTLMLVISGRKIKQDRQREYNVNSKRVRVPIFAVENQ
jgi:hypothetical protein